MGKLLNMARELNALKPVLTIEDIQHKALEIAQHLSGTGCKVEVVKYWIWCNLPEHSPHSSYLMDQGFFYNTGRQLWQNACGHRQRRSKAETRELRIKYGAQAIQTELEEAPF